MNWMMAEQAVNLRVIEADLCDQCQGTGFRYFRSRCSACLGTGKVLAPIHAPFQAAPPDSFQDLQQGFLKAYGHRIRAELPGVKLVPTQVGSQVEQHFLGSMRSSDVRLQPAYHGTLRKNFDPIQETGLRVPGTGGVTVANGSAHGVCIYTAKLGASSLSKGFSRDSKDIFVCAVADDKSQSDVGQRMGNHMVYSESKNVRHVGDAMVVFNSAKVAPLFIAKTDAGEGTAESHSPHVQQSTELDAGGRVAGKHQILVGGQKIWAAPEANTYTSAKLLRRRNEAKARDTQRRAARDQKFESHL